jgi:hypothetical protein
MKTWKKTHRERKRKRRLRAERINRVGKKKKEKKDLPFICPACAYFMEKHPKYPGKFRCMNGYCKLHFDSNEEWEVAMREAGKKLGLGHERENEDGSVAMSKGRQ